MKKFTLFLSMMGLLMSGCSDYDDSAVWNELNDHASRLAALEKWQETANGNITALQGLVTALQQNDYVTGVTTFDTPTPGGSRITFTKSDEVTIWNGMQGQAGIDGINGTSPLIAVQQYPEGSGIYYWTLDLQDGKGPQWMEDAQGNKIPVTGQNGQDGSDGKDGQDGKDGITPRFRINSQTNCWEISTDNGLTWTDTGVQATGDQGQKGDKGEQGEKGAAGDSIFAADGVNADHPDYVVFKLANGISFTLPKASNLSVGFESYDLFYGSDSQNELTLVLPETLKETDFTALSATITGSNGTYTDIQTRATGTDDTWKVQVTNPSFNSGELVPGSARVAIFPPTDHRLSETAMLTVTLTDKDGKNHSASRAVKYFDGFIVNSADGNMSITVPPSTKKLAIVGSIDVTHFTHIRTILTKLEVLDLSMTDLVEIPMDGLNYNESPNTTLQRVVLPETLEEIGQGAFVDCRALKSIDTRSTKTIYRWAFQRCYGLKEVRLGKQLETIASYAFEDCTSLRNLDIPGSVSTLGSSLFRGCTNLETVLLNEGTVNLSPGIFYNCGIVSISIPATITEIPDEAFADCVNLERIWMHDQISRIGVMAFSGCRSLQSITIPAQVTVLEELVFQYCPELKYVTLHDNIHTIESCAFLQCTSLAKITLPANLTTMGSSAFSTTPLTFIALPQSLITIPPQAFFNCTQLKNIQFREGLENIEMQAFFGTALERIELPLSILSFGENVFQSCKDLKTVICKAETAPSIESNTFDPIYKTGRSLYLSNTATGYDDWTNHFSSIIR